MEVLLTILILVMTAKCLVFIYANFIDINKQLLTILNQKYNYEQEC